MVYKSASQYVFDLVFKKAKELGVEVYDLLPDVDAPVTYPFINMGDVITKGESLKDDLFQDVDLDVHIWGTRSQRKKVTDLSDELLNKLLPHKLVVKKTNVRVLADNSTNEILWHAVLNIYIEYRGKTNGV